MKISARLDCSPTEARRLLGQPDLLPLHQIAAETFERWLVHRVGKVAGDCTDCENSGRTQTSNDRKLTGGRRQRHTDRR